MGRYGRELALRDKCRARDGERDEWWNSTIQDTSEKRDWEDYVREK